MRKSTRTILLIVAVFIITAFGYHLFTKKTGAPGVPTTASGGGPNDATLYFTAPGCESLPYVSAFDGNNEVRVPLETFPATDGYDYTTIEGTRETRTILSRFSSTCENTPPTPLDSYQVLEIGITENRTDGSASLE